ncbi:hypothetical protein [Ruegeria sp. R14_0]|uniref:hypothetical protein n=1 Tax=Ruegeria sp. R14_0 TaxID=2821100 RepID=UPI001ADD1CA5|nr:hypothetical protein [Ruegeria sp. R14_0]MBO9445199.1 hypothetical protein [Ruegeria sp. R14_0]
MKFAHRTVLAAGFVISGTYAAAGVCSLAQLHCECSALFSVIETDDPKFDSRLREIASRLRVEAYPGNGRQPVDAYINSLIKQWHATPFDHDGSVKLANALARCDRFVSGDVKPPKIIVSP